MTILLTQFDSSNFTFQPPVANEVVLHAAHCLLTTLQSHCFSSTDESLSLLQTTTCAGKFSSPPLLSSTPDFLKEVFPELLSKLGPLIICSQCHPCISPFHTQQSFDHVFSCSFACCQSLQSDCTCRDCTCFK